MQQCLYCLKNFIKGAVWLFYTHIRLGLNRGVNIQQVKQQFLTNSTYVWRTLDRVTAV